MENSKNSKSTKTNKKQRHHVTSSAIKTTIPSSAAPSELLHYLRQTIQRVYPDEDNTVKMEEGMSGGGRAQTVTPSSQQQKSVPRVLPRLAPRLFSHSPAFTASPMVGNDAPMFLKKKRKQQPKDAAFFEEEDENYDNEKTHTSKVGRRDEDRHRQVVKPLLQVRSPVRISGPPDGGEKSDILRGMQQRKHIQDLIELQKDEQEMESKRVAHFLLPFSRGPISQSRKKRGKGSKKRGGQGDGGEEEGSSPAGVYSSSSDQEAASSAMSCCNDDDEDIEDDPALFGEFSGGGKNQKEELMNNKMLNEGVLFDNDDDDDDDDDDEIMSKPRDPAYKCNKKFHDNKKKHRKNNTTVSLPPGFEPDEDHRQYQQRMATISKSIRRSIERREKKLETLRAHEVFQLEADVRDLPLYWQRTEGDDDDEEEERNDHEEEEEEEEHKKMKMMKKMMHHHHHHHHRRSDSGRETPGGEDFDWSQSSSNVHSRTNSCSWIDPVISSPTTTTTTASKGAIVLDSRQHNAAVTRRQSFDLLSKCQLHYPGHEPLRSFDVRKYMPSTPDYLHYIRLPNAYQHYYREIEEKRRQQKEIEEEEVQHLRLLEEQKEEEERLQLLLLQSKNETASEKKPPIKGATRGWSKVKKAMGLGGQSWSNSSDAILDDQKKETLPALRGGQDAFLTGMMEEARKSIVEAQSFCSRRKDDHFSTSPLSVMNRTPSIISLQQSKKNLSVSSISDTGPMPPLHNATSANNVAEREQKLPSTKKPMEGISSSYDSVSPLTVSSNFCLPEAFVKFSKASSSSMEKFSVKRRNKEELDGASSCGVGNLFGRENTSFSFYVELKLRPHVIRLPPMSHIFELMQPYDRYILTVKFGTRGGVFIQLNCMEELLGLKAMHQLLCNVAKHRSHCIEAAFVAPTLGNENAMLEEDIREMDVHAEEFLPLSPRSMQRYLELERVKHLAATKRVKVIKKGTLEFGGLGEVEEVEEDEDSDESGDPLIHMHGREKGGKGGKTHSDLGKQNSLVMRTNIATTPEATKAQQKNGLLQTPLTNNKKLINGVDDGEYSLSESAQSPKGKGKEGLGVDPFSMSGTSGTSEWSASGPLSPKQSVVVLLSEEEIGNAAVAEFVAHRRDCNKIAIVVTISQYDSPLLPGIPNLRPEVDTFISVLQDHLGFEIVEMNTETDTKFLRPTGNNIRKLLASFLQMVQSPINSLVALFMICRGYVGHIPKSEGRFEVALCEDADIIDLQRSQLIVPAHLATMKDAVGRQPLIFIDTFPLPYCSLSAQIPANGFSWLTSAIEDGGNEMLVNYTKSCGGLSFYYLLKGLKGKALQSIASPPNGQNLVLNMNTLIWFLHAKLQRKGAKVQHNAIVAKATSKFLPTFVYPGDMFSVPILQQMLENEKEKEISEMVRINVRLITRRGEAAKPVAYSGSPSYWVYHLMLALNKQIYPSKATKRMFGGAKGAASTKGGGGKDKEDLTLNLSPPAAKDTSSSSSRPKLKMLHCLENFRMIYIEYRDCHDCLAGTKLGKSKLKFFERDFEKLQTKCEGVGGGNLFALLQARRRSSQSMSQASPMNKSVSLQQTPHGEEGLHGNHPFFSPQDSFLFTPPRRQSLAGPDHRHLSVWSEFSGERSMSIVDGFPGATGEEHRGPLVLRNTLSVGFVKLELHYPLPMLCHAFINQYLYEGTLKKTPEGHVPVVLTKRPTCIYTTVDCAFEGTHRDYRKLCRILKQQSLAPLAMLISVDLDPFLPHQHIAAKKLQSCARGIIVRRVLRDQATICQDEVKERQEIVHEEDEKVRMEYLDFMARYIKLFVTLEVYIRMSMEEDERAEAYHLRVMAVRMLQQREVLERRSISQLESASFWPLGHFVDHLNVLVIFHVMRINMQRIHTLLSSAMWDRFYVESEAYETFLILRNELQYSCAKLRQEFRMSKVMESPYPPSTDLSMGHTCIESIRALAATSPKFRQFFADLIPKDTRTGRGQSEGEEQPLHSLFSFEATTTTTTTTAEEGEEKEQ